jgi:Carbohydrate family 9 binding domain-like
MASLCTIWSCQPSGSGNQAGTNNSEKLQLMGHYGSPTIDGSGSEDVWDNIEWANLDQVHEGAADTPKDFSGRYKITWDENNLYLLVEITDDSLADMHPNGLDAFFQDDCLTIFVDQDLSGGDHTNNHNAFAYSIGIDGKPVDMATDSTYQYFADHITSRRTTRDGVSMWEVAINIYDGNTYTDGGENIPRMLSQGKKLGFAVAYADNDGKVDRDGLFSNVAKGDTPDVLWKSADNFGVLELQE